MQPRESKREISREKFDAVLLDLDGVITDTASLHAACWKQVFDEYLRERTARNGETFRPFDPDVDYRLHVDGKPRFDGVRDFLASRGMRLPENFVAATIEGRPPVEIFVLVVLVYFSSRQHARHADPYAQPCRSA